MQHMQSVDANPIAFVSAPVNPTLPLAQNQQALDDPPPTQAQLEQ